MLFKSRNNATWATRLRLLVWPRVSWSRSVRYVVKRVLRMKSSPHKIALGCAAGVFASITPLIGVQMAMAGLIALICRGNLVAAMLATLFGNPISWPFIWGATYGLGSFIVGHPGSAEASNLLKGGDTIWPVIFTMLVGSIPIGLMSAAVSYRVVERVMTSVQQQKGTGFEAIRARLRSSLNPAWRLW